MVVLIRMPMSIVVQTILGSLCYTIAKKQDVPFLNRLMLAPKSDCEFTKQILQFRHHVAHHFVADQTFQNQQKYAFKSHRI